MWHIAATCRLVALVASVCPLSVFCTAGVSAQTHLFKDYTTGDGLPDSRVAPIIQDKRGYLWFGTQAGLTRYDGKEFYTFGGAKEIPGIFGRDIAEDHTGAIWFAYTGFHRGGLLRYFEGTLTEFGRAEGLVGHDAVCVTEDAARTIWVGSDRGTSRIRFSDSARTQWRVEAFSHIQAVALFVDSRQRVWIGTLAGDVYSFEQDKFTLEFNMGHVRDFSFYESSRGELWVGGSLGAVMRTDRAIQRFGKTDGLPERGVWSFAEDRAGTFWVGTASGLYRLHRTEHGVRFTEEKSFADPVVYDMCLDAEGNLWLATDPGLRKLIAADFVLEFPGRDQLATPGFGPIARTHDGMILFGSRNMGVFGLKGTRLSLGSSMEPQTSRTILTIHPESPRRIWYGMKAQGLILQDGKERHMFKDYLQTAEISVHSIARLSRGNYIFGSDRGLKRIGQRDSLVSIPHPDLDTLVIFDMIRSSPDASGDKFWFATDKGPRIVEYNGMEIKHVTRVPESGLDGMIVYDLLADRSGRMWYGSDGSGAVTFDGSTYAHYTRNDGLVGNRVYALAQDSLGQIWIGTSSGLSCFDGKSFRNFTYDQGFGEIGVQGLLTDNDGSLWVSSFPGVTKLRPQRFLKSTRPPPIYILDMQVDTLHFGATTAIQLDPDPAVITFRYAGLSFTDEANVRYKYMLEGFDRDWSPPVTQREVRYTHLGGGDYTFRVIARSADGVWSAHPAVVSFSILPPMWARWWFMLGTAVLLISTIYAFYRYRLERALQLERTRSRIAMDLHDDIGSSLTRISVLSEVARKQDGGSPEMRSQTLARIGETARELVDALGDIVWSVDPKRDDLQHLIGRVVQFGQEVCEARQIMFETEIASTFDHAKLSLEQRRAVFLICKEAINNVVKHSRASRVRFVVTPARHGALVELADDGIGYAEHGETPGNGLHSMKERARRAGVSFTTESTPGAGTRIALEIKTA